MRMPIKQLPWPKDLLKNLKKGLQILQKMMKRGNTKIVVTVDDEFIVDWDWKYGPGKEYY